MVTRIDIFCRVVDNFGDIGVVYRLVKALSDSFSARRKKSVSNLVQNDNFSAATDLELRLVLDDRQTMQALSPSIDPDQPLQTLDLHTDGVCCWIVSWDYPWEELFHHPADAIIETFACNHPDWYEALLYDPGNQQPRRHVNLEFLTAEPWAREYHLLPSLSPLPQLVKYFFQPGFTSETGGLIIDSGFSKAKARWDSLHKTSEIAEARKELFKRLSLPQPARNVDAQQTKDVFGCTWISVFSYEHDYTAIVSDLCLQKNTPLALVSPGPGQECFLKAWTKAGSPFPLVTLPFLPQEDWDEVLLASDFSIVRGEESFSRAALSGRPFVWHAYFLVDGFHLPKVEALLERMKPCFSDQQAFDKLRELFLAFNAGEKPEDRLKTVESFAFFLEHLQAFSAGFQTFSEQLLALGDLGDRLLAFLLEGRQR